LVSLQLYRFLCR